MHEIEPFYNWQKFYEPYEDPHSPYFEFIPDGHFSLSVYDHYIHPDWDELGSETLYCKIIMVNYNLKYMVIELIGEWNDTLHNDIMHLKRNLIDNFIQLGINKFILIGENVFQFHGGEDDYYEEWFDEAEDGWLVAIGFRDHILAEWTKYHIDSYFNFGGSLNFSEWRTFKPDQLFLLINKAVTLRLNP